MNALFLLVELLERARQIGVGPHQLDDGEPALPSFVDADPPRSSPVADEAPIGRVIPAALAFLGVAFTACALVTARLPPLSGFVAKRALLSALPELRTPAARALFGLLILSGLFSAMALMRVGVRHFWTGGMRTAGRKATTEGRLSRQCASATPATRGPSRLTAPAAGTGGWVIWTPAACHEAPGTWQTPDP